MGLIRFSEKEICHNLHDSMHLGTRTWEKYLVFRRHFGIINAEARQKNTDIHGRGKQR
jgi:hypothetical protein